MVTIQSGGNFSLQRALTATGAPVPNTSAFVHTNSKSILGGSDYLVLEVREAGAGEAEPVEQLPDDGHTTDVR
jgi:hypothetical protein